MSNYCVMKIDKRYIYTFLSVLLSIMLVGYSGVYVGLDYMEGQYVDLQIDVNRRQAETMSKLMKYQLSQGDSKAEILEHFQEAIFGSESEKGFLCMFDKTKGELVCHPDTNMIGMSLPGGFLYSDFQSGVDRRTLDVLSEGKAVSGLFHTKKKTDISYMAPVEGTDWMISAHENIEQIQKQVDKQQFLFNVGFVILGFFIAVLSTFSARRISRRYEKKIEEQNKLLGIKNTTLQEQKEEIEAGIQYASRIQAALLPPRAMIRKELPRHFIVWKPRDIVSGDFYWFKRIDDNIIFVAADSTGHGVPGAFMSMLGIAFMNEIITEDSHHSSTCKTNVILNDLRSKLKVTLRQSDEKSGTKDGYDLSLLMLNTKTLDLSFSGANNSIYIVRDGEQITLDADRMPVGVHRRDDKSFTRQDFQMQKGDMIYMASDGFEDQFGGGKNRKYLKKKFRDFLLKISDEPVDKQKQLIQTEFNNWKGDQDQVDDVLVTGIRV